MKSHFLLFTFLVFSYSLFAQFSKEHIAAYSISDVRELAHGDLDGDGDEDIAFVSNTLNMVAWLENLDGEGKMSLPIILDETFYKANAIRIADLNNDGHLDIVVIGHGETSTSQVAWYPNEGAGIFAPKQIIHQQSDTSSNDKFRLEIMDVDGDNDLDLMLGFGEYPAFLMWIENFDGLGNFLPPTTIYEEEYRGLEAMALGDMDNDNDLDVVVVIRNITADSLFWFENNNGNFSEAHFFFTINSQKIEEIEVLDADGDNDLEVITMTTFSDDFYLFENQGGGNMASPIILPMSTGINPQTFCVGDVDADTDLDIIFFDGGPDNILVMENLDDAIFATPQAYNSLPISSNHDAMLSADLNGDGAVEILPSGGGGGKILLHKNDGFGDLSGIEILTGKLNNYGKISIADFDNNGFPDITGELFLDNLVWYKNEDNQFLNAQYVTGEVSSPFLMIAVDLNADGMMDLLTASDEFNDKKVVGLFNDGTGKFPISTVYAITTNDDGFDNIIAEDLDSDGDVDLILVKFSGTYWMENTDGLGTFGPLTLLSEIRAQKYLWNDFDGDGDNDFCLNQTQDETIYFLENIDGNGTFAPAQNLFTQSINFTNFSEGDFDADGDLDIAMAYSGTAAIEIFYNNNQDFSQSELVFDGSFFSSVGELLAFDVDYDGLIDLVYEFDDGLAWQKNLGNGLFSNQIIITDNGSFSKLTSYDMDGDGDEDLVASGFKKVSWFENVALNPIISAINFYDNNENGLQENEDFLLFNTSILLQPNGLYTFPNNEGIYKFAVNNGTYNLSVTEPNGWALTSDSLAFSFEVAGDSIEKKFGYIPLFDLAEMEANLTSGPPRCSQEVPFWLGYHNTGTVVSDALIQLEIDNLVGFVSATPLPDSIQGNIYYWNVTDVLATHLGSILLTLLMPDANSTGVITSFPYETTVFDANNNPIFQQQDTLFNEIRCAYDPNDKMVVPDRGEPYHPIGLNERLEYTVRFQNTGNDTAYNVFIKDQLDENLDWTTLTPLQSSHSMETTLDENGLVTFRFINIFLPDSLSNPAGSQGFVKYQIDLKSGLSEGLVIENTAQIIFDSNPAIITNTTQNTISSEFTVIETPESGDILVEYSPNPFSDFITFKINGSSPLPEMIFEIFDMRGQKIESVSIGKAASWTYYPERLVSGVFIIQLKNKNTRETISKQKIIYIQNN